MLNERAQILLKALVERYIADGQPVGSRSLAQYTSLDLSPASIRHVMADLEDMGLVASPHHSAGRVPTAQGFQFFVDRLMTAQPLESLEINRLKASFSESDPDRVLEQTSHLLSQLTRFAGIVMVPRRQNTAFRQIEFLHLGNKRVLLIIISTDGDVQNRILQTDRQYSNQELQQVAQLLNQYYAGTTIGQVQLKLHEELKSLHRNIEYLMQQALNASARLFARDDDELVVSGEHNLLNTHAFSNIEQLRKLFDLFEEKTTLVRLLDLSQQAEGVQIFIGQSSDNLTPDDCSVVTAPYHINGRIVGTLGVIGPNRMAYNRVVPIVDITARLLSNALSTTY